MIKNSREMKERLTSYWKVVWVVIRMKISFIFFAAKMTYKVNIFHLRPCKAFDLLQLVIIRNHCLNVLLELLYRCKFFSALNLNCPIGAFCLLTKQVNALAAVCHLMTSPPKGY